VGRTTGAATFDQRLRGSGPVCCDIGVTKEALSWGYGVGYARGARGVHGQTGPPQERHRPARGPLLDSRAARNRAPDTRGGPTDGRHHPDRRTHL
jgi:hypothetical protein